MISLVIAILIYQVLAFLGVDAVSQIVTYIAYRKQDLDIKLMYSQKPLDLIFNYNKFDKSSYQKMLIIFSAAFALSLGFIPTIFTKLHKPTFIYSAAIQVPLEHSKLPWSNNMMPVIDNFLFFLQNSDSSTVTEDILVAYLKNNLLQNITDNFSGVWYGAKPKPTFPYFNDQRGGIEGFTAYNAFGHRPSDTLLPASNTIQNCLGFSTEYFYNMSTIAEFNVTASSTYTAVCYPIYDKSVSIYRIDRTPNSISVLSANDDIYRASQLPSGVSAHASFGVSLLNHNRTHMSMGIKKMASITMYTYNATVTPPSDCNPVGKTPNATISFKDLPSNQILCHFIVTDLLSLTDNDMFMQSYQATRRYFDGKNHALNAVYTTRGGGSHELGLSVMVDLNMFAVYTIEGQLADEKEHLLAYEAVNFGKGINKGNITFESTLDNNNLEYILDKLDSTVLDEQTVKTLATLASIKARWSNNDFSDFVKNTIEKTEAVETSQTWITAVTLLLIIFLVPQFLRLLIYRIPYYSKDFRTIVVSVLGTKTTFETESKAKKIAIVFSRSGGGSDVGGLLTLDGNPLKLKNGDGNSSEEDGILNNK